MRQEWLKSQDKHPSWSLRMPSYKSETWGRPWIVWTGPWWTRIELSRYQRQPTGTRSRRRNAETTSQTGRHTVERVLTQHKQTIHFTFFWCYDTLIVRIHIIVFFIYKSQQFEQLIISEWNYNVLEFFKYRGYFQDIPGTGSHLMGGWTRARESAWIVSWTGILGILMSDSKDGRFKS